MGNWQVDCWLPSLTGTSHAQMTVQCKLLTRSAPSNATSHCGGAIWECNETNTRRLEMVALACFGVFQEPGIPITKTRVCFSEKVAPTVRNCN
eukprot:4380681-Amphidinium_carterae.1